MEFNIPNRLENTLEMIVSFDKTALSRDSGLAEVLATPALIELMEQTCHEAVQPLLPEGLITVGTQVNMRHLKATTTGKKVRCDAKLISRDRQELTFKVEAFDETGLIGEGTHARFVVDKEKFMSKIS